MFHQVPILLTQALLIAQDAAPKPSTPSGSGAAVGSGTGTAVAVPAGGDGGFSILPNSGRLADAIRTGDIHISDIPEFISYFISMGIVAAGSIAFLMLLYGGYQYIIGGVYSDMRDQGKTTITYAITGLVLSLLSYAIVSIVQLAVTAL